MAAIQKFSQQHPDVKIALSTWKQITEQAQWKNLLDIKQAYSRSVDRVEGYTVFNIKGNHYRLIAKINYKLKIVKIENILTHSEYDRGKWKT
jgi:mRNA interferase HigB